MGTSKIADLASVPGPVAAISLLPSVSAMQFLQRVPHGASPSGHFAVGGASPAVLWLRGAPPSSTHGPNEEANAVMAPPWWMEKRETFPHKNGRPPHGLLSNKHILKTENDTGSIFHALRRLSFERLLHALQAPRRWSFQSPLPWTILILVVHRHMLRFPKLQEPLPSWHGQLIPIPRPLQDFCAIFARQSKHLCDTALKALPRNVLICHQQLSQLFLVSKLSVFVLKPGMEAESHLARKRGNHLQQNLQCWSFAQLLSM